MHILADLLELLMVPGTGPESPRGWLWISWVYGVVLSCVLGYTLLNSPSNSDTATVLALVGAPLAIVFAVLQSVREPDDRQLAAYTIVANAMAIVFALTLRR